MLISILLAGFGVFERDNPTSGRGFSRVHDRHGHDIVTAARDGERLAVIGREEIRDQETTARRE